MHLNRFHRKTALKCFSSFFWYRNFGVIQLVGVSRSVGWMLSKVTWCIHNCTENRGSWIPGLGYVGYSENLRLLCHIYLTIQACWDLWAYLKSSKFKQLLCCGVTKIAINAWLIKKMLCNVSRSRRILTDEDRYNQKAKIMSDKSLGI